MSTNHTQQASKTDGPLGSQADELSSRPRQTYHNQSGKINPTPESVGVLDIIHYINPASKTYHLQKHTSIHRSTTNTSKRRTRSRSKQTCASAHTYHDQRDKIHPIPERMGVLYIIHYIYPALKADYLEGKTNCAYNTHRDWSPQTTRNQEAFDKKFLLVANLGAIGFPQFWLNPDFGNLLEKYGGCARKCVHVSTVEHP